MVEFIKQFLAIFPAYFDDLIKLITGPKRFVADRLNRRDQTLKKSLLFLAVSYLIVTLVNLPLNQGQPQLLLVAPAIFTLLYVCGYACATHASWRLVGGSAPFQQVLPIYFYYAGVLELIMAVTYFAMMGALRTIDPGLYQKLMDAAHAGKLFRYMIDNAESLGASSAIQAMSFIEFLGLGVMIVWFIAGWGAYRTLNGLSKFRSVMAALLFVLLSIPVTVLSAAVAVALVT